MNETNTKELFDNTHTIKAVDFIQDITLGGDLKVFLDFLIDNGKGMVYFYSIIEKPQNHVDIFNDYLASQNNSLRVEN